jgi:hypothetical protein
MVNATLYRSIVGNLRYLVHAWPVAVGMVSRYMEAPTTEHMSAFKHLLRYIAGTIDYGCIYTTAPQGASLKDRKSTTDTLFFYGNFSCCLAAPEIKGVSLWSEYIAAACQGVWLGHLPLITELCVDNMSAIQLCKNPVFHDRSKQIEGRYHFIREFIEDETVTVDFIGTDEQLTDIFTKALGRVRFQVLRWKIKVFEVK